MLENFTVDVLKHPTEEDWMLVKKCTLVTVGKDSEKPPTMEWKKKLIKARHSPIRELKFVFRLNNIPSWVATHLARHVHAQPYIKSQRNDRQDDYDRNAARQDALVDMCFSVNGEEIMTIANKRYCMQASPETRLVVKKFCEAALEANPEFEGQFIPMCAYRGGHCDEFNCCGLNEKYKN